MKKLLLTLLFIVVSSSFTLAQSWSSVSYTYTNGPISPKFQRSYTITVDWDRYVTMVYNTNTDGPRTDSYSRRLSKSQFKKFTKYMKSTGFLAEGYNPNFMDIMKIGGPTKNITINFSGDKAALHLNERLGEKSELEQFQALAIYMEKLIPSKEWKKHAAKDDSENLENMPKVEDKQK